MSFLRNSLRILSSRNVLVGFQTTNTRNIKRWVAPTLRELNKRSKKVDPETLSEIQKRNTFIEWNYNSEVYAFGQRLKENFDISKLQRAFVNRSFIIKEELRQKELGIENPEINLQDNISLVKTGQNLVLDYVTAFLEQSLPKVPKDGIQAFTSYLTSVSALSNIAKNLGCKDLILSDKVDDFVLADTLLAVIGALQESSGDERAYNFIRDFVCTQLNQKDVCDIWDIPAPFESLKSYCSQHKLADPEPRLIGESARNTVLAVFNVGIYSNKQLIGQGFGEDVETAIQTASIQALRQFYGIGDNMKPFDFSIKLERKPSQKVKLQN